MRVCLRINASVCVHKDKHVDAYIQVPECMRAVGDCVSMQHIYLCIILYIQVMDVNMHICTYEYTCR